MITLAHEADLRHELETLVASGTIVHDPTFDLQPSTRIHEFIISTLISIRQKMTATEWYLDLIRQFDLAPVAEWVSHPGRDREIQQLHSGLGTFQFDSPDGFCFLVNLFLDGFATNLYSAVDLLSLGLNAFYPYRRYADSRKITFHDIADHINKHPHGTPLGMHLLRLYPRSPALSNTNYLRLVRNRIAHESLTINSIHMNLGVTPPFECRLPRDYFDPPVTEAECEITGFAARTFADVRNLIEGTYDLLVTELRNHRQIPIP